MMTPTTVLPAMPSAEIQIVTSSPSQSAARYCQRMCQSIACARERPPSPQRVGFVAEQRIEEARGKVLPGIVGLPDLRHARLDLAGIAHAEVDIDAVPFLVKL